MKILIKDQENKGFAMARIENKRAGIMTYQKPSPEYIIIDHTIVEPEFKGKGVAKQLLYKVVGMARENNLKIVPECSYAVAMFKKLTDLQDVLK